MAAFLWIHTHVNAYNLALIGVEASHMSFLIKRIPSPAQIRADLTLNDCTWLCSDMFGTSAWTEAPQPESKLHSQVA